MKDIAVAFAFHGLCGLFPVLERKIAAADARPEGLRLRHIDGALGDLRFLGLACRHGTCAERQRNARHQNACCFSHLFLLGYIVSGDARCFHLDLMIVS